MSTRNRLRGSTLIEFTLVGIPMIFILLSIAEMARGLWVYHSLAVAVNSAARLASLHGAGCGTPNSCTITIGTIATNFQQAAPGLIPGAINVSLISPAGTTTCNPLSTCGGNSTQWPPSGGNSVGANVEVSATYVYQSGLSIFVPGSGGLLFGQVRFTANSRQQVQF
jgi:Flp pilus assembly protein TadG